MKIHTKKYFSLTALALFGAVSASHGAILTDTELEFADTIVGAAPADFTITLDTTPYTDIIGSMLVTFETVGDFAASTQSVDVRFEGSLVGTLWNSNTFGDTFSSTTFDVGNSYGPALQATFSLPEAVAESFLADGQIEVEFFNFSDEVRNVSQGEYITVSLEFTPVPEPSTYALMAGLLTFAAVVARRRK